MAEGDSFISGEINITSREINITSGEVNTTSGYKNITSGEDDVTDVIQFTPIVLVGNYITLLVSLVIVFMETVVLIVLQKCRRIHNRSLYLSTSLILSDLLGALAFAVHQIIMYGFGYYNDFTHVSRTIVVGALLTVTWASVAALSFDRLLAIKHNLTYNMWSKECDILCIISMVWALQLTGVMVFTIAGMKSVCGIELTELTDCDIFDASKITRFVITSFLLIYELVVIGSYSYIYRIASRHARSINTQESVSQSQDIPQSHDKLKFRQINRARAVLKIVLSFAVLHGPMILKFILFEAGALSGHPTLKKLIFAGSYLCIQLNSFVSMYLYAGNFKEMKMHFYFMLAKLNRKYVVNAEHLRIDVYSIVTSEQAEKQRQTTLSTANTTRQ